MMVDIMMAFDEGGLMLLFHGGVVYHVDGEMIFHCGINVRAHLCKVMQPKS